MTAWIITSNLTTAGTAITANSNDLVYVSPNITVTSTSGNGIYAPSGNITATIMGSVFGTSGGLLTGGGGSIVTIGAGASVNGTGIDVSLAGSANLFNNAGTIAGAIDGLEFTGNSSNTLINSGNISAVWNSVVMNGGFNNLDNTGIISSTENNAIRISSAYTDGGNIIDNSGTIIAASGWDAITTGDASATITNSGHIVGNIVFGSGGGNSYDGSLGSITGTIYAGSGANTFTGGSGIEKFDLTQGTDTADGGGGNDTFYVGSNLANVSIDGGTGTDTVVLSGNYSAGLTITPEMIINVEKLQLTAGNSYNLTTNDSVLAAGATLTIDGSALGAANALIFNGSKETNGHLKILDGLGADTISVGSQSDKIIYASAADSTSTGYDTVVGWNFGADKFDIPGAPGTIKSIDATVASGTLSTATFDANLTAALSGHLLAHTAILFKPNAGTLSGSTFMVVDTNGIAGYQAGQDLVVCLKNSTGTLAVGGFV